MRACAYMATWLLQDTMEGDLLISFWWETWREKSELVKKRSIKRLMSITLFKKVPEKSDRWCLSKNGPAVLLCLIMWLQR